MIPAGCLETETFGRAGYRNATAGSLPEGSESAVRASAQEAFNGLFSRTGGRVNRQLSGPCGGGEVIGQWRWRRTEATILEVSTRESAWLPQLRFRRGPDGVLAELQRDLDLMQAAWRERMMCGAVLIEAR